MTFTTLKSVTEENKNIGWFAKLSITFLVLLFLAGIASYLYYFFKVDKLYARKTKRKKNGVCSQRTIEPQSPIDAATAVVTAVFQSPVIIESEEGVLASPTFKQEEMDEINNRPPPIPIKPLPVSLNYEKPLEVDKLPAHLFGKTGKMH